MLVARGRRTYSWIVHHESMAVARLSLRVGGFVGGDRGMPFAAGLAVNRGLFAAAPDIVYPLFRCLPGRFGSVQNLDMNEFHVVVFQIANLGPGTAAASTFAAAFDARRAFEVDSPNMGSRVVVDSVQLVGLAVFALGDSESNGKLRH